MRGNLVTVSNDINKMRSIPAHAGQPFARYASDYLHEVYPRACGATQKVARHILNRYGLSPRMRGNPTRTFPFRVRRRSIPAHAGQPVLRFVHLSIARVYPRACGAT